MNYSTSFLTAVAILLFAPAVNANDPRWEANTGGATEQGTDNVTIEFKFGFSWSNTEPDYLSNTGFKPGFTRSGLRESAATDWSKLELLDANWGLPVGKGQDLSDDQETPEEHLEVYGFPLAR